MRNNWTLESLIDRERRRHLHARHHADGVWDPKCCQARRTRAQAFRGTSFSAAVLLDELLSFFDADEALPLALIDRITETSAFHRPLAQAGGLFPLNIGKAGLIAHVHFSFVN